MFVFVLVVLIYCDGVGVLFVLIFFVLLLCGGLFWFLNCYYKYEFKVWDGFLIVVLFWIVIGSVGVLFFLFVVDFNILVIDVFFEFFLVLMIMGVIVIVGLDEFFKVIFFYC